MFTLWLVTTLLLTLTLGLPLLAGLDRARLR